MENFQHQIKRNKYPYILPSWLINTYFIRKEEETANRLGIGQSD